MLKAKEKPKVDIRNKVLLLNDIDIQPEKKKNKKRLIAQNEAIPNLFALTKHVVKLGNEDFEVNDGNVLTRIL